jgi:metallophosphoesterase (TIGR00282 family)
MRIIFIGDIVGAPGRRIIRDRLADVIAGEQLDLVIANGENAASGFGITPRLTEELLAAGIDVLSGGNHIWDRREILEFIPHEPRLLRPANFPDKNPGHGAYCGTTRTGLSYAVICLQGRVMMSPNNCPFRAVDCELTKLPSDTKVIVVDMHAEATSEKRAMGWYLDGRVSAVVGTHTHVATADEQILPKSTAYISDVGMTGPHDSIIGIEKGGAMQRFLDGLPARFEVASADVQMNAVIIEADPITGRALSIERRCYKIDV